jgi:hypothetical protein
MSRDPKDSPELPVAIALAKHYPWLGRLLLGAQILPDHRIEGISIRIQPGSVLVIVRALSLVRVQYEVAFGSGETLFVALRNVTVAIGRQQWKPDKFRKMV